MRYFLTNRLPIAVLVIAVGSVAAFLVPRLAPGDPAAAIVGQNASDESYQAVRQALGLDLPLWQQYLSWISGLLHGDLGVSFSTGRPAAELIGDRLPATVELAVAGTLIMIVVGFTIASIGSTTPHRAVRGTIDGITGAMLAVPAFLVGLVLIIVFGILWPVLPVSGTVTLAEDPVIGLQYLILPAITVAIVPTVVFIRLVQAQMRKIKNEEYVATAIVKGIPAREVRARHIRRNALSPAIVVAGVIFGELLGGAVVVEYIFGRDGLGSLAVSSVANRDYMVTQVLILGAVVVAVGIQLTTELIQSAADPRIRLSKGA